MVNIIQRCFVASIFGLLALLFLVFSAHAVDYKDARFKSLPTPIYTAEVVRVIDGDSFKARVMLAPNIFWEGTIRIKGVDTPELRGKCRKEKRFAKDAKRFTEIFLSAGKGYAQISGVRKDKYGGRFVAYAMNANEKDLTTELIKEGYAVPYKGHGKRKNWCD